MKHLTLLVALCFAHVIHAQLIFESPMADPVQIVSTSGEGWTRPVFMDLDGDGLKDMVHSKIHDDRLIWYKNEGQGEFGPENVLYQSLDGVIDLKLLDMNGDGLQDLLIQTHADHTLYAALRQAGGDLGIPEPITSILEGPYGCAGGDLNGDGWDDAIALNRNESEVYWISSLGQEFSTEMVPINSTRSVPMYGATGDVDLDGDVDVLVAHHGNQGVWSYTQEAGNWIEFQVFGSGDHHNQIQIIHADNQVHVFSLTVGTIWHRSFVSGEWGEVHTFSVPSVTAFDVIKNNNGTWTLWTSALASLQTWASDDLVNWENLGETSTSDPYRYVMQVTDLFQAGEDLLVGSVFEPNRIYGHSITGMLPSTSIPWTSTQISGGYPLKFVQADADEPEELLIRSDESLLLFNRNSLGVWDDGVSVMNGVSANVLDARDVDGDGDDDVLFGNHEEDRWAWIECLGNGTYSAIRSLSLTADCYDVAWVDVNGDGLLDATTATYASGELLVALQSPDEDGVSFEPAIDVAVEFDQFPTFIESSWGDLNNDGLMDVIIAAGTKSAVGLQDAELNFEWSVLTTGNNQGVDMGNTFSSTVIMDVDGNGWNDVVFGNWGYATSYIKNENGHPDSWNVSWFTNNNPFTWGNINAHHRIRKLLIDDVNNDGRSDIISCRSESSQDGVYAFSISENWDVSAQINLTPGALNYPIGNHHIIDADVSDVDLDGDLDMVGVQYPQNIVYFIENRLEVVGCTDPQAVNFDAEAEIDNGLCVFLGEGCDDGMSATYNDQIQADGSCLGQAFNGENVLRINCGYILGQLDDVEGNTWDPEQYAIGGGNSATNSVAHNVNDEIMRHFRYSTTGYDLPVDEPGQYLIRLHFSANRNEVQQPGFEVFHVLLEGDTVEVEFDIYAEAGNRQTWIAREYFVETLDEVLSLRLPVVEWSNEIVGIELFRYQGDCVDLDLDDVCDDLEILGCTDEEACNFDSEATEENESCEYVSCAGCTDAEACNYDEGATYADASCIYPEINYGCDGLCLNDFDSDGICDEFEVVGCIYMTATNYNPSATNDDGSCVFEGAPSGLGCTYAAACNFDSSANVDDGSCVYALPARDCDGNCYHDQDGDGICDEFEGCTIPLACNYNEAAIDNDGCCIFPEPGQDCEGNCTYDTDEDGICDENELAGCTDPLACNYSMLATDDNGQCVYAATGEDCDGNCLSDLDGDGVCDGDEIAGCADALACNYNADVTDPDGSCVYPDFYYGCDGLCLNDADGDGICDQYEVPGCTYATAVNFMQSATDDDGSCIFEGNGVQGCFYSGACNYNPLATEDNGSCVFPSVGLNCDGECLLDCDGDGICDDFEVAGCTDETACNYDAGATDSVDNCEYLSCADCTDPLACNYNALALYAADVCEFISCAGCMLEGACNYDPSATIDAGTCEFESCAGCTYPEADNYDPTATIDDGSCVMDGAMEMVADSAYTSGYEEGLNTGEVECEDDISSAFTDGFDLGVAQGGNSAASCGPGTVWNEDYQFCLPEPVCEGDLNDDGVVGVPDLLLVLSYYMTVCD